MGKVKRLWEAKIDEIEESYYNEDITYEEAFSSLCRLGYESGLAADVLDAIREEREIS
jgi:hypothetical protein